MKKINFRVLGDRPGLGRASARSHVCRGTALAWNVHLCMLACARTRLGHHPRMPASLAWVGLLLRKGLGWACFRAIFFGAFYVFRIFFMWNQRGVSLNNLIPIFFLDRISFKKGIEFEGWKNYIPFRLIISTDHSYSSISRQVFDEWGLQERVVVIADVHEL